MQKSMAKSKAKTGVASVFQQSAAFAPMVLTSKPYGLNPEAHASTVIHPRRHY